MSVNFGDGETPVVMVADVLNPTRDGSGCWIL